MLTSPLPTFKRENQETVSQTRKQLKETEEIIQLKLNRLKLLNRDDKQYQQKIDEIKRKTMSMIELKLSHHEMIEQKKLGKRSDEEHLKLKQDMNRQIKIQQQVQLDHIKQSMNQIKQEEKRKIKNLSKKNAELIEKQRDDYIRQNREKRERIQEVMHKSKSNISLYWDEKLRSIQRDNERVKQANRKAYEDNKILSEKLDIEDSYLQSKLKKSMEVQRKLAIRLDRAKKAPLNEFNMILEDDESFNALKSNNTPQANNSIARWLPTPEKDMGGNSKLETEPQQIKSQQNTNQAKTEREEDQSDNEQ